MIFRLARAASFTLTVALLLAGLTTAPPAGPGATHPSPATLAPPAPTGRVWTLGAGAAQATATQLAHGAGEVLTTYRAHLAARALAGAGRAGKQAWAGAVAAGRPASPQASQVTQVTQVAAAPRAAADSSPAGQSVPPRRAQPQVFTATGQVARFVSVAAANVRSGPGTGYPVVGSLARGAQVRGPSDGAWVKIGEGRFVSLTVTSATEPTAGRAAVASPRPAQPAASGWDAAFWAAVDRIPGYDPAVATFHARHQANYGVTDLRGRDIWVGRHTPVHRLYAVVTHEYAHQLMVQAYGRDWQTAVNEVNRYYGTTGLTGVEYLADCAAYALGADWGHYLPGGCTAHQMAGARAVLAGKQLP